MDTPRATIIPLLALATLSVLATPTLATDVAVRLNLPEPLPAFVGPHHGVVSLVPEAEGPEPTQRGQTVTLGQRNLQFEPRVLALQVGDTVVIGNADDELHSVHCHDPRSPFQLTVPPAGRKEQRFDRPGVFDLLCDFHLHMRAYAVVSDHPWIASLDGAGQARISGVPPGGYRLVLWHEWLEPAASEERRKKTRLGRVVRRLQVTDRDVVQVDLSVRLSPLAQALSEAPPTSPTTSPELTGSELARRTLAALHEALEAALAEDRERTRARLDDVRHGHYGGPSGLEVALRRQLHRQRLATLAERLDLASSRLQALAEARDHRDQAENRARQAVEALESALANAVADLNRSGAAEARQKD